MVFLSSSSKGGTTVLSYTEEKQATRAVFQATEQTTREG